MGNCSGVESRRHSGFPETRPDCRDIQAAQTSCVSHAAATFVRRIEASGTRKLYGRNDHSVGRNHSSIARSGLPLLSRPSPKRSGEGSASSIERGDIESRTQFRQRTGVKFRRYAHKKLRDGDRRDKDPGLGAVQFREEPVGPLQQVTRSGGFKPPDQDHRVDGQNVLSRVICHRQALRNSRMCRLASGTSCHAFPLASLIRRSASMIEPFLGASKSVMSIVFRRMLCRNQVAYPVTTTV